MNITPCVYDPAGWDLPVAAAGPAQVDVAAAAVAGCLRCPALARCERDTRRWPPEYDCVQAGLVWYRDRGWTLDQFRLVVGTYHHADDHLDAIADLYRAGLTDADIAAQLQLSTTAVKLCRRRMGLLRPRARLRSGRQPCGTAAAARRHRTNGEPLDEACRQADRRYDRERRARSREARAA